MRSVLGRAVVVAGAVVVALGSTAGAAAAKPQPPALAFSPAPYNYGQVAAGGAASQTFTLANTGGQATVRRAHDPAEPVQSVHRAGRSGGGQHPRLLGRLGHRHDQ
jgi:hypothetical protein